MNLPSRIAMRGHIAPVVANRCLSLVFALAAVFSARILFVTAPCHAQTVSPEHAAEMKAGTELFKSTVRAILAEHCLDCHGGKELEGDFSLADRDAMLASGIVDLKDVSSSHFLAVIRHDSEPHMPKGAERLPDDQIAAITRWLELGAPFDAPLVATKEDAGAKPSAISEKDRAFWSFRPLNAVAPPTVKNESWVRTPIDRFILHRLESEQIEGNVLADKRRLVRRAFFDLTGLPPSAAEVESFASDLDPESYSKLLDRLLESPHYGEKWARHWMDIARFAESHGYEQDYDRPFAYHYRDFLIKALNSDMPYDQFVRWQVAGDELAPDQPLAMMATGFLGAASFPTQLTEQEFESARYEELDDMVSTMSTAILGLSVGCARCHAHKFDPIPMSDYYRLTANLSATIRSDIELDLDPEGNHLRRQQYEAELARAKEQLQTFADSELHSEFKDWLSKLDPSTAELKPWRIVSAPLTSTAGSVYQQQPDGSWLATGTPPNTDALKVTFNVKPGSLTALRIEALADDSLPNRGPGRAGNGNFVLSNLQIFRIGANGEHTELAFGKSQASHQQNAESLSVAASIDKDPTSGWAVDAGGIGKDQIAVFELTEPSITTNEATYEVILHCEHPNPHHVIGRLRLAVSDQLGLKPESGNLGPDDSVRQALAKQKANLDRNDPSYQVALNWYSGQSAKLQELASQLKSIEKRGAQANLTKVMVASEGLPHQPHHADDRGFPHFYPETHILVRGDVTQKRGVAEPGYLQILMRNGFDEKHWQVSKPEGWTRTSFRRASLANWLTDVRDGAGHLAARVIVNRIWQHHFGRGIVASPSDFGLQGEAPSHPELLDWLAVDLVQNGWKLKRLHKLIMMSAVYMQSSQTDSQRMQIDRENRLLWRYPPHRLEAESIRDTMLQVSGTLDPAMYGPGTLDESMTRRSIYFFIKRSALIPTMMLFDWPEHLVGIGQRPVTTVAPQALAFLNSPHTRAYAVNFAEQLEALPTNEAIVQAYKRAFGRLPSVREAELGEQFLNQQRQLYKSLGDAESARQSMQDYCQAILSMNELIYLD